jgi:hypothetical protein
VGGGRLSDGLRRRVRKHSLQGDRQIPVSVLSVGSGGVGPHPHAWIEMALGSVPQPNLQAAAVCVCGRQAIKDVRVAVCGSDGELCCLG